MSIPPAWHPDPLGRHDHRWWDGERWTEHVADAGQASIDPIDAAPAEGGDVADTGTGTETTGGWAGSDQGRWAQPDRPDETAAQPQWGSPGQTTEQPQWGSPGQTTEQPQWGQAGQPGAPGGGQAGPPGATWPTQGGGPPPAGGTAVGTRTEGMAIGAIIVGVLSLLVAFVPLIGLLGFVGGVIALVLGLVALRRIRASGAPGRGQAITGIVTGALAIVVTIVWMVVIISGIRGVGGLEVIRDYAQCVEETGDEELCQRDLTRRFFGD